MDSIWVPLCIFYAPHVYVIDSFISMETLQRNVMLLSALSSAWVRYGDDFTQKKIKKWVIQHKVKCLVF